MKLKTLGVVAALFASSAMAAEQPELIVGGFSYHTDMRTYTYQGETHKVNEVNPTVGIGLGNWSAAAMLNTYNKWSLVTTYNYNIDLSDHWIIGVKMGTATGYKDTPENLDVAPVFMPEVAYRYRGITTVVGWIPPLRGTTSVFTLHWRIKF